MLLFYLIALIEGFSTLAVEIIAIRLAAPIVGSSIILTSVFLGIILLALSAGYYVGGILTAKYSKKTLIKLLGWYLIGAGAFYLFLSFTHEQQLLANLLNSTDNYVLTLFVTAIALFFLPVFVASQTLPILTELIDEQSKGKAAGKILFASTVGSFFGSVLTSIVLFQRLGVSLTALVVGNSLLICAVLLWTKLNKKRVTGALIALVLGILMSIWTQPEPHPSISYQFDSAYQEIIIRNATYKEQLAKIFHTNGSFASAIIVSSKESPFSYIQEAVTLTDELEPRNILVIGTAGFTYPYQIAQRDYVEQIDAVDIDPAVKRIAEAYFLEDSLPEKVTFIAQSARYFVNEAIKNGTTYDLIFVDAYNGKSLPEELTTREFFAGVEQLSNNGKIVFNMIMDKQQTTHFSQAVNATLSSVFPTVMRKNVSNNENNYMDNFIVTTRAPDETYGKATYTTNNIYTDNMRTTEHDLVSMYWNNK